MCGLFFTTRYAKNVPSLQYAQHAAETLNHRGPDQNGVWISEDESIYTVHFRLSINDLSEAGRQPMHSKDERYVLVFNGEIYNYAVLKVELETKGYKFKSTSDTEVILYGFAEWGKDLLLKLQGMYAFVIWDKKDKRVFAARDHVGIKPLFYVYNGQDISLASETTALAVYHKKTNIDPEGFAYVMSLGYVPHPKTIWKDISNLPPGHYMELSKGKDLSIQPFWKVPESHEHEIQYAPEQLQDEFEGLFEQVVEEHLLSDVPISLFLSGGIDSSAIAVALSKKHSDIEAITLNFPYRERQEVDVSRKVAEALGLKHRIITLDAVDLMDQAATTAGAYDQPQGYSALMSMMMISDAAAQDYKVALAGDGGDEVFAGYPWYKTSKPYTGRPFELLRQYSKGIQCGNAKLDRVKYEIFKRSSSCHNLSASVFPRFLPEEINGLLSERYEFSDETMLEPLRRYEQDEASAALKFQKIDIMTFCNDCIMAKADRASMYYSLEVRVPFLDRRLIEWSFTRPLSMQHNLYDKGLVRKYLAKHLPAEVLNLPKQGFSVPMRNMLDDNAMVEYIYDSGLVKDGVISKAWRESISPYYQTAKLWTLYFAALWYDKKIVYLKEKIQ